MSRQILIFLWRLLPVLLVAGCAQQARLGTAATAAGYDGGAAAYAPARYYPPPGTPDDPWGPYINEAAARFAVPAQWIRAVMAQESGGDEQAVSSAGAIGLMQVMPDTYEALRESNGLGADPFSPEDNILAGAAYIREMYDRYGAPGFLAAYNAGPDDLDNYLAGGGDLPAETVNYLAAVAPNLGTSLPMTGPLAAYAAGGAAAGFGGGCDVDAAYDPSRPCAARGQPVAPAASTGECDADAAYDPDDPCAAAPGGQAGVGRCDVDVAYDADHPCSPVNELQAAPAAGSQNAY